MDFKVKDECMVCPVKIWDASKGVRKKTDQYHETDTQLDDGTIMTIGVCAKHQKIDLNDIPRINQKLQQGWLEEVALGLGDAEWVKNKAHKLTVIGAI